MCFSKADTKRKHIFDDLIYLSDEIQKPKINMLFENRKLLINSSLIGFCPYDEKYHEILEIKESDQLVFPSEKLTSKDINIKKWEGCSHYYVTIGSHQLDGKFNTIQRAEEEAHKLLKKLNKGVK